MTQFITQLTLIINAANAATAGDRAAALATQLEQETPDVIFAGHNGDVESNPEVEAECAESLQGSPSRCKSTGIRRLIRMIDSLYDELAMIDEPHFTDDHMDILERRFFEIREAIHEITTGFPESLPAEVMTALSDCVRLLADFDNSSDAEGDVYRRCLTLLNTHQPHTSGDSQ